MEVKSKSVHLVQVSHLGEMWWTSSSQEAAEMRFGDYLWVSASCPLLFPGTIWVGSADSGQALELSPPPLLTLSGLATEEESFSPECPNPDRKDPPKRRCLCILEGMGVGFVIGIQTPKIHRAALSSLSNCHLQPPALLPLVPRPPPPFLGCLQPYLETHGGLRWDGAISRKCSGIFIPGKKKKRDLGMSSRIEGSGC